MRQLFIADLHLQQSRPELIAASQHFLTHIAPGANDLYLLGDLFEYWIGDDAVLPGLEPFYDALEQLSQQGTRLHFQAGNRDFLVGQKFLDRFNAKQLDDICMIDLDGRKTLLLHGDLLCTDDTDYLAMRQQLHNQDWQQAFLSKSVTERIQYAEQLRQQSRDAGAAKAYSITDVNADAVRTLMHEHDVDLVIHGHTHRPAIHYKQRDSEEGERIVLGDWGQFGWYAEHCGKGQVELKRFPSPEARQD